MADKHGAHQTGEAYVVSLCEDFCKSPTALVGYMISQKLDMSTLVCGTVNGCGTPVLNMSSRITHVTGNEAGVGGGVVSGVNVGMCRPVSGEASSVRAEGQCVLRHGSRFTMNTASTDSEGDTDGALVYAQYADTSPLQQILNKVKSQWRKGRKVGTYKDKDGNLIDVFEGEGMPANAAGLYVVDESGPWIAVHPSLPGHIQQSTIRHEIGHYEDDFADGCVDGVPNSGSYDASEILARERQIRYLESPEAKRMWPSDEEREAHIKGKQRQIDVIKNRGKATEFDRGGLLLVIDNGNVALNLRRKLGDVGKYCHQPQSSNSVAQSSSPSPQATHIPPTENPVTPTYTPVSAGWTIDEF